MIGDRIGRRRPILSPILSPITLWVWLICWATGRSIAGRPESPGDQNRRATEDRRLISSMFDILPPTRRRATAVARRRVGVIVNRLVGMALNTSVSHYGYEHVGKKTHFQTQQEPHRWCYFLVFVTLPKVSPNVSIYNMAGGCLIGAPVDLALAGIIKRAGVIRRPKPIATSP